jgi:hypothetical protein
VRLEADTQGGTLHVRADVVGDDGRAQTFRRLTAHVGGPDGFARDIALEASGAGRYAANVPLERPGTYVATAKDEVTGESVGTTGAVLTAGEELRPTGSDRALLTRIAQMTGGTMRDTLAGIYDDRAARRFAYSPLAGLLVLLSAIAMLLGVAARRLGVPTFVSAGVARASALFAGKSDRAGAAAAKALGAQKRAAETEHVHAALLEKKRAVKGVAPGGAAPDLENVNLGGGAPRAGELSAPVATLPPEAAEVRTLSAAERLAQKRRERK